MKIVNTMSLNVLIVDDDPVFVMIHKLKVKMSSISDNPQTYLNGKTAYEAILNGKEKDDTYLVFLDINMPIMDGWELLNAIEESGNSNKVYVVVVTSSVDKRDREQAKKYSQVIGFYEKALNVDSCIEIKTNPAIAHFFEDSQLN